VSLLDKARKVAVRRHRGSAPSRDELALAVAFLRGEVTGTQAATAVGMPTPGNYWFAVTSVIRRAVAAGMVRIEVVK